MEFFTGLLQWMAGWAVLLGVVLLLGKLHHRSEARSREKRRRMALVEQEMLNQGLLRTHDFPMGRPEGIVEVQDELASEVSVLGAHPEVAKAIESGDWSSVNDAMERASGRRKVDEQG